MKCNLFELNIDSYNNRAKSRNLIGSQPLSIRVQTHCMTNRSRTASARLKQFFFQTFSLFLDVVWLCYCKKQIEDVFFVVCTLIDTHLKLICGTETPQRYFVCMGVVKEASTRVNTGFPVEPKLTVQYTRCSLLNYDKPINFNIQNRFREKQP